MNKTMKWIFIIAGSLVTVVVIAALALPIFIDAEQYRPQIEQQVAKATGRTFTLGGDLKPSFFPWIGVRLSDLHLGNPPGFKEKDFISVESFEVRVKLLPLLSRNIEVKRFVVNKPVIVLEKHKDGKSSWEGLGQPTQKPAVATKEKQDPASTGKLPIKGLMVGEFSITDGLIVWLDQAGGTRKEVKDINLVLTNVSLDNAIGVAFSALADKQSVEINGTIGPVGDQPGMGPIPLDLAAKLLRQLDIKLSGRIDPSTTPPRFDLAVDIAEFSPRKLMDQLDQKFPLETADDKVLDAIAVALNLKGTPENIVVSGGKLKLDDSQATFSAQASEFDKPNLKADFNLDHIDLDRYLPPPTEGEADAETAKQPPADSKAKKTDYDPLRRLVMDARFKVGKLKAKKVRLQNLEVRVSARNGILQLDPLKLDLYKGNMAGTGKLNVQKDKPKTALQMVINGVQAGPFIKDFMAKELIEGALVAKIGLNFTGDTPDLIRQTLGGKGNLQFNDGALVGVDLASMVRNVQASFGLAEKTSEKPRTDFAELQLPYTIKKGLFKTSATRLVSPLLRVMASGKADLVKETLDFRIEPKVVATIKGQGDTGQHAGIMVPVLVSGSFTSPAFKPDLSGMLKQSLPGTDSIQKMVPQEKSMEEGVKSLMRGLPFGNQ